MTIRAIDADAVRPAKPTHDATLPAMSSAPPTRGRGRFTRLLAHPEFRRGAREMVVISPGLMAWGLVTGVAMVKAGLTVPLALLMTFVVYAGSAQLAALPLLATHAPVWLIWATAFCVNLRFVVFSAHWRPYLMHLPPARRLALAYISVDTTYVLFMKRHPVPRRGIGQTEYLIGADVVNWLAWQVPSVAGILLVDAVPVHWGLGFAGALALLGMGLSMLSDRATGLAAAVAGAAAVAAYALPLKLNIVVAIAAAVAFGLLADEAPALRRRLGRLARQPGSAAGDERWPP